MPKNLRAEAFHANQVARFLASRDGLDHLRVRRRGALITIESGPKADSHPHARLRRARAVGPHANALPEEPSICGLPGFVFGVRFVLVE